MSTESFFANPKPTRLLLLVLILSLYLWRSSDGGYVERRAHRSNNGSRSIFCVPMKFACLDKRGKTLGYICVEFHPKLNFYCEYYDKQSKLLDRCHLNFADAVSANQTIVEC